ncbi:MAG TPA: TetR/AcrR family transcriptional regulator [Longilinea sp.]|nr:TetR/AcrR family transcriptional regulator [Longilinea sp.]
MPKGITLTDKTIQDRQQQISAAAKELFLSKGFRRTSMQDIAQAVDAGKSTLYDYFQTKDDILIVILEEYINDLIVSAEGIYQKELPARDKLKQIMLNHMQYLLCSRNLLGMMTNEVQRMGALKQMRFQQKRLEYQTLISTVIQAGVQDGSFRPVDSMLCANMVLVVTNPTVLAGIPAENAQQKLDEIVDIFFGGLEA